MLHSCPTLVFKPLLSHLPILYLFPSPSPPFLAPGRPSSPPASFPLDFLTVFQWNAGGLRARSTKILHFLLSDCTHSRSGILSRHATYARGGVIIFVRQGLSFSELSTSSLFSLDPYSDYVRVNISLNNFSSVSFLNVYAPPIRSFPKDSRIDSFSPSILFSSRNLFILGGLEPPSPSLGLKRYFRPPREGSIRLGHLLPP